MDHSEGGRSGAAGTNKRVDGGRGERKCVGGPDISPSRQPEQLRQRTSAIGDRQVAFTDRGAAADQGQRTSEGSRATALSHLWPVAIPRSSSHLRPTPGTESQNQRRVGGTALLPPSS